MKGGTPLEQRQQWHPWGTDGAEGARVRVRLLGVGEAVKERNKELPGEDRNKGMGG